MAATGWETPADPGAFGKTQFGTKGTEKVQRRKNVEALLSNSTRQADRKWGVCVTSEADGGKGDAMGYVVGMAENASQRR